MTRLSFLILALSLWLSACGSAPPAPVDRFYRLQPVMVPASCTCRNRRRSVRSKCVALSFVVVNQAWPEAGHANSALSVASQRETMAYPTRLTPGPIRQISVFP